PERESRSGQRRPAPARTGRARASSASTSPRGCIARVGAMTVALWARGPQSAGRTSGRGARPGDRGQGEEKSMRRQSLAACLLLPLLACGGPASEPAADTATPNVPAATTTIALPEALTFPEGIAHDSSAGVIYTASAENGAVARIEA